MPRCSLINPTGTPYQCLRAGISVGKNLPTRLLPTLSKDVLRDIARKEGIRNYSNMSKAQLYQSLIENGVRSYLPFQLGT